MTHVSRTPAQADERQKDHHEHDHSHGHEHGRWSKIRHGLDELFGGHSHDATDTVDSALEADARGRRALWISLAALGVTAALQGTETVPGMWTGERRAEASASALLSCGVGSPVAATRRTGIGAGLDREWCPANPANQQVVGSRLLDART